MNTVDVPALGRHASIGDGYDARQDKFLGFSILKDTIPPPGAIRTIDNNFTDTKIIHSKNRENDFNMFQVKGEAKLSVLANLVQLEGSARFLQPGVHNSNTHRHALVHTIKTKYEELNLNAETLMPRLAFNILNTESIPATHVVIGIEWGANLTIEAEYSDKKSEENSNFPGNIDINVPLALFKAEITGQGEVDVDRSSSEADEKKFTFSVFGDIISDGSPGTVDEVSTLIKSLLPRMNKANGGKGKPMVYKLVPTKMLKDLFKFECGVAHIYSQVQDGTISLFEQHFSHVGYFEKELHCLERDANSCLPLLSDETQRAIETFLSKRKLELSQIRSKLTQFLVDMRSGISDDKETLWSDSKKLDDTYATIHQELETLRKSIQPKIGLYAMLISKYPELIYVKGSVETLQSKLVQHKELYILFSKPSMELKGTITAKTQHAFFKLLEDSRPNKTGGNDEKPAFFYVDLNVSPDLEPKNMRGPALVQHYKEDKSGTKIPKIITVPVFVVVAGVAIAALAGVTIDTKQVVTTSTKQLNFKFGPA